MKTKLAIQSCIGGSGFITEDDAYPVNGAYRYSGIEDALLFPSVNAAAQWLERTAFINGQEDRSYCGAPRFTRIEETSSTVLSYRVLGPVE